MAATEDFLTRINPLSGGGGGLIDMVVWISLGTMVLALCGGFLWYMFKNKKNYNLSVEFRLPRDIRKIQDEFGRDKVVGSITKEWGKGFYDNKKGTVFLKRKKKKPVAMKPFDVKRFLSDSGILTVMQVGAEDYRPVLEDSYLMCQHLDADGKESSSALIDVKIDTTESKNWMRTYERENLDAFTIISWMQQHGQMIGMGFVIMSIFVGFTILYGKIA